MSGNRGTPYISVLERDLDNPEYRKQIENKEALENVYPEAMLPLIRGAVAPLAKAVDYIRTPSVVNEVVGAERVLPAGTQKSIINGRPFTTEDNVKYAFRNTYPDEILAAKERGYLMPNPANKYANNTKWWSAGDEAGVFGRAWVKGPETIRVPIGKVSKDKAVKSADTMYLDKTNNIWRPLSGYAN